MPTDDDRRIWNLLTHLFNGDQEMIWAMLDHVQDQREQLRQNRGQCRQKMLMESATWRKVIAMPVSFYAPNQVQSSASPNVTNSSRGTIPSSGGMIPSSGGTVNSTSEAYVNISLPMSSSVPSHLEASSNRLSLRANRTNLELNPAHKPPSFRFPATQARALEASSGSSPSSAHTSNMTPFASPLAPSPQPAQQSISNNKSLPDDAMLANLQNIGFAVHPSRQMLSLMGTSSTSESSPKYQRQTTDHQAMLAASPIKKSLLATLAQKEV